MSTPRKNVATIADDGYLIDRAIVLARRRVILTHRHLGVPLVIWHDGQVVEIDPFSVALPEVPPDPGAPLPPGAPSRTIAAEADDAERNE